MGVAQQLERLLRQNAHIDKSTKLSDFRIKFEKIAPVKPEAVMTPEQQAIAAKAIWKARLGME